MTSCAATAPAVVHEVLRVSVDGTAQTMTNTSDRVSTISIIFLV
jgi:hypothetical protein